MKVFLLFFSILLLLFSCKNESTKKTPSKKEEIPETKISNLDKFKTDGMEIIDTSFFIDIFARDAKPRFTAKFKVDSISLYLCEYMGKLTPDLKLSEFVLYDGANEKPIILPQITATSYELNSIVPYPEFTIYAWLPDSVYNYKKREYIKQKLIVENGDVKFKNKLIYSPPAISETELDSLISQFEDKPIIKNDEREKAEIADEMVIIKMFLASINGNKKCEKILYRFTDKYKVDGGLAETYFDYIHLDKLLKNKK